MMSLSGPCNSLTSSALVVNELTTIAAQWALARFIGLTGQIIGSSSTNATGLNNAVNLAFNDLVSITGVPAGFLPTTAQCSSGSPPVNCDGLERLDTLANSIASCINSSGSSSTQCEQLFCAATPDATWNGASCSKTPAPTDTLAAAHAIVTNPTANADTIFGVSPPPGLTLFEPVLSSAPADWTLALNFAPPDANFGEPASLALDSAGNVWVGNNYDGVTELDSNGALVGNFDPPGANFDWPVYLAIDSTTRNVWVTNWYGNSVTELNSKGALVGNFAPAGANFLEPGVEALDVKDNLWVVNSPGGAPATRPAQSYLGNSVTELNSSRRAGRQLRPCRRQFQRAGRFGAGYQGERLGDQLSRQQRDRVGLERRAGRQLRSRGRQFQRSAGRGAGQFGQRLGGQRGRQHRDRVELGRRVDRQLRPHRFQF